MDVQAFLITFREALEAMLIVGIATTYLSKIGASGQNRWIWLGTLAGLAGSLVAAYLLQVVLTGFAMMNAGVWLKVGIMFAASLMLAYMVFWMAKQGRSAKSELQASIDQCLSTGRMGGLVFLAFAAVLREGVETVFFFAAITEGDITRALSSWGALGGLVLAFLLSMMIFRGAMRVPLQSFFKVSGILLLLIAAGLFTQGVAILQDLRYLGSIWPEVYNLTWLMPEHPLDGAHLLRDTGVAPLIPGEVGLFFRALFGYMADPSIEEIAAYLGFYVIIYAGLRWTDRRAERREQAVSAPGAAASASGQPRMVASDAPEQAR